MKVDEFVSVQCCLCDISISRETRRKKDKAQNREKERESVQLKTQSVRVIGSCNRNS